MLDVRIVLDDVPEYVFRACGATTQDERDTISACVRTYARDCIAATLLTIEDGPVFKDAWRYRVMVENGVVPSEWRGRDGYRVRADAAFDQFVTGELSDYDLREQIRQAIAASINDCIRKDTSFGSYADAATEAVMEVLRKQEPVAFAVYSGWDRKAVYLSELEACDQRDRRQLTADLGGSLEAYRVVPLYTSPGAKGEEK